MTKVIDRQQLFSIIFNWISAEKPQRKFAICVRQVYKKSFLLFKDFCKEFFKNI